MAVSLPKHLCSFVRKTSRSFAKPRGNPLDEFRHLLPLQLDVLTVVLLLFIVLAIDSWTDLVLRITYTFCGKYGLRRRPLFLPLCLGAFLSAMVFSGHLVCVPLLFLVNRCLSTLYGHKSLDRMQESVVRENLNESMKSCQDTDALYERLAVAMCAIKWDDYLKRVRSTRKRARRPAGGGYPVMDVKLDEDRPRLEQHQRGPVVRSLSLGCVYCCPLFFVA